MAVEYIWKRGRYQAVGETEVARQLRVEIVDELPETGSPGIIYIVPSSEEPSGEAKWGSITGTLSNQTDLQEALDSKLSNPINEDLVIGSKISGDEWSHNLVFYNDDLAENSPYMFSDSSAINLNADTLNVNGDLYLPQHNLQVNKINSKSICNIKNNTGNISSVCFPEGSFTCGLNNGGPFNTTVTQVEKWYIYVSGNFYDEPNRVNSSKHCLITLDTRNDLGQAVSYTNGSTKIFLSKAKQYDARNYYSVGDSILITTKGALYIDSAAFGESAAINPYSFAHGRSTAVGTYSHAEGYMTYAYGESTHAEGGQTIAYGGHAEGSSTISFSGHAEGVGSITYGAQSHAEGLGTLAAGVYSHAEGTSNFPLTKYDYSGISDFGTKYNITTDTSKFKLYDIIVWWKSDTEPNVIGYVESKNDTWITVVKLNSTSMPISGVISRHSSCSFGYGAHTEGTNTIALGDYSKTFGKYNLPDTSKTTYVEIVGNGSETIRSNARTLDWNGNESLAGSLVAQSGVSTVSGELRSNNGLITLNKSGINYDSDIQAQTFNQVKIEYIKQGNAWPYINQLKFNFEETGDGTTDINNPLTLYFMRGGDNYIETVDIVPKTDNTYHLGYDGAKFNTICVTNISDGTNTTSTSDISALVAYAKSQGWIN